MKQLHLLLVASTGLLAAVLCLAASRSALPPNADSESDFSNWRNKPHEPFSDGAKAFDQVKKLLLERYHDQKLTEDDIYRAAVQGMLTNIDPDKAAWNRLLTPGEFKELMSDASGRVVGIGVVIGFDDDSGLINVVDVIKDSPAQRAGIKPGDKILKIDGKNFHGQQLRDVVYAMRGTPGTAANLSVLDGDQVRKVSVKRVSLTWETVTAETLPNGLSLLTIRYFTQQTPELLKKALAKILSQNTRGLIVDLRGNEGGLLDSAIESLDRLVPKGSVIVKATIRGGEQKDFIAKIGSSLSQLPIAVLINGNTKSSAEIAAGALQQNCKATLIGHKTFGKWNAQRVEELPNKYAVKFTTTTFLAPNGNNYSLVGLPPDITVDGDDAAVEKLRREMDLATRVAKDIQLQTAVNFLQKRN